MVEDIIGIITYKEGVIQEAKREDFNMKDLCNEVYIMITPRIEEKKLDYIQIISPEIENSNVNSEKNTIKQIIFNLLSQAVINTPKGQVKVDCSFTNEECTEIKIGVSDDGKLIKKEDIKKINRLLNKVDCDKNFLGSDKSYLTICKMLVEKIGGHIWVDSDFGLGNTVYFTFDVDQEEISIEEDMNVSDYMSDKDAAMKVRSMTCHNTPFKQKVVVPVSISDRDCCSSILLVDDNYFNIEVLQSLIEVQLNLE